MVTKNITIAMLLIGLVAFMALAFRPGSVSTVGQGGGYGNEGGIQSGWGGGEGHDEQDDD